MLKVRSRVSALLFAAISGIVEPAPSFSERWQMALVFICSILAIVLVGGRARLLVRLGPRDPSRRCFLACRSKPLSWRSGQAFKKFLMTRGEAWQHMAKLRGNMRKPTTSFIRSTAGSTKASRQLILLRQKRCWTCRNQSAHSSRGRRSCGAQPNLYCESETRG